MSDVDSLLRERLGAAAAFDVDADPQLVREGVARRQRRIRRRRRGTVVLAALAVAGLAAGVVGLVSRDGGEDVAVRAGAPSTAAPGGAEAATAPFFRPLPGWDAVQVGGAATAASVALGPDTAAGGAPWDTVARLGDGDVVLFAMVSPAGDTGAASAAVFPQRALPLSLDDARPGGLEGQPDGVHAERLAAQVDGWNIDVVVFYGADDPTSATRLRAEEQLAQLVVPARAATAAPAAPGGEAAAGSCRPSDLQALVALDATGGTLDSRIAGRITVRNVGPTACTLADLVAQVEPRDTNSTVLPSTSSDADPAWRQAGEAAPSGWPTVRLGPGAEAQAVLAIHNWCGAWQNRLYFVIHLPGQAERIGGAAPSVQVPPQCDDAQAPMQLAVGPFEPPRPSG